MIISGPTVPAVATWADLPEPVRKCVSALRDGFNRRFDTASHLLTDCAIVNPDTRKLGWFADKPEVIELAYARFKDEMVNLIEAEAADVHPPEPAVPEAAAAAAAPAADEVDQLLAECGIQFDDPVPAVPAQPLTPLEKATEELNRYKNKQIAKVDPMTFWGLHAHEFPTIAKLAMKYLAIPASSAPSERAFSQLKLVVENKRWNTDPDRVCALVFLRCNKHLTTLLGM